MVGNLRFIVPLENETRWSDLLAVLIFNDPIIVADVLGLGDVHGRVVSVSREVTDRAGRVDLLVYVDGRLETVLEVKVLSGLGRTQLARYESSYPDASAHLVAYPERLVIDPGPASKWHGISWESLLRAFAESTDSWVAQTSQAWLDHLAKALPQVEADSRWNDLHDGDLIPLIMWARMSWVYSELDPPPPLTADFMPSTGSKGWVARLQMPAPVAGYVIAAEVEDPSARAWPTRFRGGTANPVEGPRVWVGLRQHGVSGSENFDWEYLAALWPLMRAARNGWMTTRPGLRAAHDRAGWHRIGSPIGLGYGFGHREATQRHVCMFGARFRLPADIRLHQIVDELHAVAELLNEMAKCGRRIDETEY